MPIYNIQAAVQWTPKKCTLKKYYVTKLYLKYYWYLINFHYLVSGNKFFIYRMNNVKWIRIASIYCCLLHIYYRTQELNKQIICKRIFLHLKFIGSENKHEFHSTLSVLTTGRATQKYKATDRLNHSTRQQYPVSG